MYVSSMNRESGAMFILMLSKSEKNLVSLDNYI